ncbi:SA1320 family protein [Gemella cuniculi]|uniref:SA1320 family protein n=1 Tax=Gemella cuniculi TaxID=150240 RepID=UPI0003FB482B|nr:Mbeg1-like protein [Gemella cuniculi]
MQNNTLYASEYAYGFEKARIEGEMDNILKSAQDLGNFKINTSLEYLEDAYDKGTGTSATAFKDKDTGEIILAYTGTNKDTDLWSDVIKTDMGEIALGLSAKHYDPAYKFYEKIRAKYGENIILTGHSLGGNIAQRVALEYNVQKTIVYNSAPLYIPLEQITATIGLGLQGNILEIGLNKIGISIKDAVAYPIGMLKNGANWLLGVETEEAKIQKLKESFTGQVLRIRSELDIVNNVSDYEKGEYLGVEYILKNSGWHNLSDILNSEELKKELERITKQLIVPKTNIDIDGDGKIDIKLGLLDLRTQNLLRDRADIVSGEKIKLSPEVLKTLSRNIQTRVLGDLETIQKITKLCIEKNNKVGMNFNKRKEQVSENIKEEFNNAQVPVVLDNLGESVGELQKYYELKMDHFSTNEKAIINGYELNPEPYNTQLTVLRHATEPLLNQSIKEETRELSNFFQGRPTILKSWQEIESITKYLLEESDKTFEGDGLRTGKEDGISQSLKQVLEVAEKNIEELEKQLQNTAELTQGLAENFEEQDKWIGRKLQQGNFIGSNPIRNMPTSYKVYLDRDEIFDDVKDVIQAFEKQVEKRSKEYARKVTEITGRGLEKIARGLEGWLRFVDDVEKITTDIEGNYNIGIEVEEKYTEEYQEEGKTISEIKTKTRYWGELKKLYPEPVVTNIKGVREKIISKKSTLNQAIQTIKNTQNNLSYLEPNLKKIIEEGVYKAFDLDEIMNSQKIAKQIAEKSQREIKYVREHIGTDGMSGEAIKALDQKLGEVNKSLEYYKMFLGDCFGN